MMPIPRQVKFRVKGLFSKAGLIVLALLLVFVMVGWESACRIISYKFGISSTAIVDSVKEWKTYGRGNIKTYHYGLVLLYPVPDIKYNSGVVEVTRGYYTSVKKGDEVAISFYDKLPGYPMISGGTDLDFFYIIAAFLIFFIGLIVAGVIKQRYYLVNGIPVLAAVTNENRGYKGYKMFTISYNAGKSNFVKDIYSKGIGDTSVLLLIMPEKPDSCMIYEKFQLWDVDDWGTAG